MHVQPTPSFDTRTEVPREVLDGIEAVRSSGRTNMLDRLTVVRLADQLGFQGTVLWIHDHLGEYARGLFHGFRAEPEPSEHGAPDA